MTRLATPARARSPDSRADRGRLLPMAPQRRTPRGGPGGTTRPGSRTQRGRSAASRPATPAGSRRRVRGGRPRRPRLTGRAAVLVLVLAVLTVSYASSLRAYLQQRSHISELKTAIAEREASINDLEREKQRWEDPAYVKAQARARFGYLMPGRDRLPGARRGRPAARAAGHPQRPRRRAQDRADRRGGRRPGTPWSSPATRPRPSPRPRRSSTASSSTSPDSSDPYQQTPADVAAVAAQLGREPRAIHEIGHRCPCGNPDVVTTLPRLPNGTPFPTTYYLTCPRAASRIGTLEGSGLMKEMQDRLGEDPELAAAYRAAHEAYLAARDALGGRCRAGRPRDRGDQRRRHARPGQVPARPGRPVAGPGARRQPARRRGARPAGRVVGQRPLRRAARPPMGELVGAIDCGTNSDQAAHRHPARRRAARLARGAAGPGRRHDRASWPTRRWPGPSPRSTSSPGCSASTACRPGGPGSAPPRPPATPATPPSSSRACAPASG